MNRRLIKVLIVIWSLIAIFFVGILVYGITSGRHHNFFFSFHNDLNSKTKVQVDKEIDLTNINTIKVDCTSSDIVIKNSDSSNMRVVQKTNKKLANDEKCLVEQDNNEVTIQSNHNNNFGFFFFSTISDIIEIYIPKDYSKDLIIETSSGDIEFDSDINANKLSCNASSGDIYGKNQINSKDVKLNVSSGDIEVADINSNTYDIETSSGDITVDSLSGSGEASSSSGDIELKYKDIADYSKVNATSGDIDLKVPDGLNFEFKGYCTSGDIDSNLDYKHNDDGIGAKATIKVGSAPYKKIDANTTSGDITINK